MEKVTLNSISQSESRIVEDGLDRLHAAYEGTSSETPRDVVNALYSIIYLKGAVEQRNYSKAQDSHALDIQRAFFDGERKGLREGREIALAALDRVFNKE